MLFLSLQNAAPAVLEASKERKTGESFRITKIVQFGLLIWAHVLGLNGNLIIIYLLIQMFLGFQADQKNCASSSPGHVEKQGDNVSRSSSSSSASSDSGSSSSGNQILSYCKSL